MEAKWTCAECCESFAPNNDALELHRLAKHDVPSLLDARDRLTRALRETEKAGEDIREKNAGLLARAAELERERDAARQEVERLTADFSSIEEKYHLISFSHARQAERIAALEAGLRKVFSCYRCVQCKYDAERLLSGPPTPDPREERIAALEGTLRGLVQMLRPDQPCWCSYDWWEGRRIHSPACSAARALLASPAPQPVSRAETEEKP